MESVTEIDTLRHRLLSSIDLDEVAETCGDIICKQTGATAIGVIMWDVDLEAFSDRFFFGPRKKDLVKVGESFAERAEPPAETLTELDTDVKVPGELEPLFCLRVAKDEELVACIIIAGSDDEQDEILEKLAPFPFLTALSHCWQVAELKKENERLRSQYEEMEDKTSLLEDQTMKVIHELTVRDTIRTRHVERERLVYWISNAVRSSVHIQEVLETTVEKIGTTLKVSRCLLLRSVDTADQLNVFEWNEPEVPPVRELFFCEEGLRFTGQVLQRTSPHDIILDADDRSGYDQNFLRKLGMLSGLLVPLIMRERVLGVMFLQDCAQSRAWSIDDVSLIGSLADNLSVAIENAELHQERERQAVTDGLTGVANRRSFNETFSREFERARRYGETLSLVVIDLDFLKKINDTYGHQAGDEAIKTIGRMLKQSSRSVDLPARYGGEEFCLLLPNTDIEMAEQLAERLRRLINEVAVDGPGNISASLGVANYPLHANDPEVLFQKADEALYAAKQGGRNRVCVSSASNPESKDNASNGKPDGDVPGASSPADASSKLLK